MHSTLEPDVVSLVPKGQAPSGWQAAPLAPRSSVLPETLSGLPLGSAHA